MNTATRALIVEARFYEDIADELAAGAIAELERAGVAYDRIAVPGAFEVPAAIRFAATAAGRNDRVPYYDGYVALGCVIRGETDHYDHICRETSRALMSMSVADQLAIGFGILTCETYEQARVRAAVSKKNKGRDAAIACLRMIALHRELGGLQP